MSSQNTSGVASAPMMRWRWRRKRTSSRWQRENAGVTSIALHADHHRKVVGRNRGEVLVEYAHAADLVGHRLADHDVINHLAITVAPVTVERVDFRVG